MENIFPDKNNKLGRPEKEKLLGQKAKVIWLTGLSAAGKTTIGRDLEKELFKKGFLTQILDGDNIRSGINSNLGFSSEDRYENIRRISEVTKLFIDCGIICINSFITPTNDIRKMAKDIIGEDDFIEVFVNAPVEVCEQRDPKGLYKKAREGKIKDFTGIDAPFDIPENPDIEIRTDLLNVEESVQKCLEYILPKITYQG
jgi:adenylylsulfate kinase